MIKRITDFLIDIIYKAHAYLLTLNDSYEAYLSDKELHFLIIGIMGILMLMVFYPLFKWLAKKTFGDTNCLVLCVYSISGNNFCDRDCSMVLK